MANYTDFALECVRGTAVTLKLAVTEDGLAKDVTSWGDFGLIVKPAMTSKPADYRCTLSSGVLGGIVVDTPATGLLTATIPAAATMGMPNTQKTYFVDVTGTLADTSVITIARGTLTVFKLAATALSKFTPKSVAGLTLWLAADKGLYTDVAHTAAATADGASILYWKDASGKSHPFSNETALTAPTKVLGVFPNLPVVRSDGTQFLSGSLLNHLISSNAYTVFLIGRAAAGGADNLPSWISDLRMAWALGAKDTPTANIYNTEIAADATAAATYTIGEYALFEAYHSDTTLSIQVDDGSPVTAATTSTYYGDPNDTPLPTTQLFRAGSTGWLTGEICELLVYNVSLASADKLSIRSYLRAKWGIPPIKAAVTLG